jgi:GTP-binding protein
VLIDTAGMRRKRGVKKDSVEALSVYQAIKAMERSHVVVLMIDASEGAGEQDAKIAGLAVDRGRGLVIVLNKTDLLSREALERAKDHAREVLSFVPWAPIVTTSAKTGNGLGRLLERVGEVVAEHDKRVTTAEINRFFEEVLDRHPPPSMRGKPVRLYYVTQVATRPPTFVAVTNEPTAVHFSYQRYVTNQIRERFGFRGVPVRVKYRGKKKKQDG